VYDANQKTIEKITRKNFEKIKKDIIGVATTDVTGGMLHKVEEGLNVSKKTGIKTLIINGMTKGNLKKAILGKEVNGTRIEA
jgi:isopentenyl phosphate kinase